MHIKPKIYHSLDSLKALYNIYIVPDVYYCNKLQCLSRTARTEESLTLSTSDDFTIRLITETFSLT